MPQKAKRAFSDLRLTEFKAGKILVFLQLLSAADFNRLALMYEHFCDVKRRLFDLYEYRRMGIESKAGSEIYLLLKVKRDQFARKNVMINMKYKQMLDSLDEPTNYAPKSKKMKPMQIEGFRDSLQIRIEFNPNPTTIPGLPGHENLTVSERVLCSQARLEPLAYLQYKEILLEENSKLNFLPLVTARKLLKIDVNKTRRIYDHLLDEDLINESPQ